MLCSLKFVTPQETTPHLKGHKHATFQKIKLKKTHFTVHQTSENEKQKPEKNIQKNTHFREQI